MTSLNKYNTKGKFIVQMETTANEEIFESNVTKTRDGRTRRQREDKGNLSNISDVTRGSELKQS